MNPVAAIRELYSECLRSDGSYSIIFDDINDARKFAMGMRDQFVECGAMDRDDEYTVIEQRNTSVIIRIDLAVDPSEYMELEASSTAPF
jgi:hypothetical protein